MTLRKIALLASVAATLVGGVGLAYLKPRSLSYFGAGRFEDRGPGSATRRYLLRLGAVPVDGNVRHFRVGGLPNVHLDTCLRFDSAEPEAVRAVSETRVHLRVSETTGGTQLVSLDGSIGELRRDGRLAFSFSGRPGGGEMLDVCVTSPLRPLRNLAGIPLPPDFRLNPVELGVALTDGRGAKRTQSASLEISGGGWQ